MLNKILDQSRNISFMSKKAIIVGGNNIDRGLLKTVKFIEDGRDSDFL